MCYSRATTFTLNSIRINPQGQTEAGMCSIQSDGNGGHRVRFGPREWLGLATIAFAVAVAVSAANWAIMDLKIEAAIATHSAAQIHQGRSK